MLENNTDRSWFMVGALAVGGLIIGVATGFIPDMLQTAFAKVTELLSSVTF